MGFKWAHRCTQQLNKVMGKISPFAHCRMDHTFTAWLFIQNGIKEVLLWCLPSKLQMAEQKEGSQNYCSSLHSYSDPTLLSICLLCLLYRIYFYINYKMELKRQKWQMGKNARVVLWHADRKWHLLCLAQACKGCVLIEGKILLLLTLVHVWTGLYLSIYHDIFKI